MIDTIGMTDIGNGRPSNQDAYLLRQKEKNGKLYLLAVVCDGMGGLKKGEMPIQRRVWSRVCVSWKY